MASIWNEMPKARLSGQPRPSSHKILSIVVLWLQSCPCIAERDERAAFHHSITSSTRVSASATKSALEQRSIWSWVCYPMLDSRSRRDQTHLLLDNRYIGGNVHQ